MEDKTLNPGEIPEDMPALNLDSFAGMQTPEVPSEDTAAELVPVEEYPEEVVVLDAAPPEQEDAPGDIPAPEAELPLTEDTPVPCSDPVPAAEPQINLPCEAEPQAPNAPIPMPIPFSDEIPEESDDGDGAYTVGSPAMTSDTSGDTMVFHMDSTYEEQTLPSALDGEEEFSQIGDTTAIPPAAPQKSAPTRSRPVRKSRPSRKKGDGLWGIPHLLATGIWLAIILLIGVSLGRMLWLCAADVLAFGRESKEVVITINANDTIEEIAEKLHAKGLVKYPGLFKLYADIAVDDGEIAPGTYTLDTILDYHALVGSMSSSSSSRAVVEDVLIPEGYNCRQIFELLEQNGICTVAELEEYAANGEFQEFWFLEDVERGDKYCLEGFLFPDTYDFYAGSTPREALGKMLLGFNSRIDREELEPKLAALNERVSAMMKANGCSEEFIAENQFGLYELLTVASLIEEETAGASESPTIASVIFNRLTENEIYERYLGIDAAIIYATGSAENIDTGIDSPYNTYTNAGLTPTPISNPGLTSINAALEFADTDYYYYVLNPETQLHQFSKTYEEHQKWVEKFRGDGE